jgi:hypothetical protein
MNKRKLTGSALLGILLAALAFLPTRSYAQSPRMTAKERHCVAALEPVSPGAERTKVASFSCYPTFSEAILAATDGAVWLPPDEDLGTQLNRLDEEQRAQKSYGTKATFVIATDFRDTNFLGPSLSWTRSAPCSATVSYQAASMPAGWNDVVSSSRGFSKCNTNVLYENNNFGGALRICSPDCATLGVMNDRTSSRKWSH